MMAEPDEMIENRELGLGHSLWQRPLECRGCKLVDDPNLVEQAKNERILAHETM